MTDAEDFAEAVSEMDKPARDVLLKIIDVIIALNEAPPDVEELGRHTLRVLLEADDLDVWRQAVSEWD